MADAVSRRPFTAEARVRSRVRPCGICGLSGTGTDVFPSSSVCPRQHYSTVALHTDSTWGVNNRPVGGRSSET
jgi:hypothetical protein